MLVFPLHLSFWDRVTLNCLRRMDLFTTRVIVYNRASQIFHSYNLGVDANIFCFHEDPDKVKTWILYCSGMGGIRRSSLQELPQSSAWTRPRTYPELEGCGAVTETKLSLSMETYTRKCKVTNFPLTVNRRKLPSLLLWPTLQNVKRAFCWAELCNKIIYGEHGFYTAGSSCWQNIGSERNKCYTN